MTSNSMTPHGARAPLGLIVQFSWTNGHFGWFTVSNHRGTGQVAPDSELALVLATCEVGDVIVLRGNAADRHHAVTVTHVWNAGAER